jgi:hypothetical protein
MAGPLGVRLASCAWIALITLAGMSSANAATGRIVFSGAIVESTCVVSTALVSTWMTTKPIQSQFHPTACGGSNAVNAVPQRYTVTVAHLSGAEPDRVLRYFNDYVRASQVNAPSPTLITQTYD